MLEAAPPLLSAQQWLTAEVRRRSQAAATWAMDWELEQSFYRPLIGSCCTATVYANFTPVHSACIFFFRPVWWLSLENLLPALFLFYVFGLAKTGGIIFVFFHPKIWKKWKYSDPIRFCLGLPKVETSGLTVLCVDTLPDTQPGAVWWFLVTNKSLETATVWRMVI